MSQTLLQWTTNTHIRREKPKNKNLFWKYVGNMKAIWWENILKIDYKICAWKWIWFFWVENKNWRVIETFASVFLLNRHHGKMLLLRSQHLLNFQEFFAFCEAHNSVTVFTAIFVLLSHINPIHVLPSWFSKISCDFIRTATLVYSTEAKFLPDSPSKILRAFFSKNLQFTRPSVVPFCQLNIKIWHLITCWS